MKTLRGPGIFLAQFSGEQAPFDSLKGLASWAASLGYVGVQIPTWDARLFDLALAAASQTYCDEIAGVCRDAGDVGVEVAGCVMRLCEQRASRDCEDRDELP